MAPFLSVPDMLMKVLRYLVSHFSSMFLLVFLDSVFPPRDNNAYIGNLFPVSSGIWPQSLPEWAFRARLGFWQICLCPKVARIAEHKLGRLTVRAKLVWRDPIGQYRPRPYGWRSLRSKTLIT